MPSVAFGSVVSCAEALIPYLRNSKKLARVLGGSGERDSRGRSGGLLERDGPRDEVAMDVFYFRELGLGSKTGGDRDGHGTNRPRIKGTATILM